MPGKWIVHQNGKRITGTGAPPEGADFQWVTETGSMHMAGDTLLIDGQKALHGEHVLDVGEEEIPIAVDAKGKAARKPARRKKQGGGGNDNGRNHHSTSAP